MAKRSAQAVISELENKLSAVEKELSTQKEQAAGKEHACV